MGCASIWDARKGLADYIELSKRLSDEFQIVLVGLSKKQIEKLPSTIIGIERTNNVQELAQRLVALYALREENIGFACEPDTEDQIRFENEFEHELTKDQVQAVIEMKKDMESNKPMDRLLCGDVGFGKTEVAIRGAYKAVSNGKQVAYLCPTTILSQQHYKLFLKRFRNEPVTIAVFNRFVPVSEQKEI